MYTLYWHPRSSSYVVMAVLEELGLEYDLCEVDRDAGKNRAPDYMRLQPLGLIPAMKIGGGRSMFESAAIVLFLCDQHRAGDLAPAIDEPERPSYLQWMLFLADTLYPSYNRYFHPERYTSDERGAEFVKRQALAAAFKEWQVIEDSLKANGPWLLGKRFSACDIYLQMITTWHDPPTTLWERFPCIRDLAAGVIARAGCRRAAERHYFQTGLPA